MIRTAFAPEFVEEALVLAEPTMTASDREAYRRTQRDVCTIREPATRESATRALDRIWFEKLGLGCAIHEALADMPGIAARTVDALVLRARSRHDEIIELADAEVPGVGARRHTLLVALRPAVTLDPEIAAAILEHKLMHIGDLLDPGFGWPAPLRTPLAGSFGDDIIRERYRVLWNATIDGRLLRAGRIADAVKAVRRAEFESAFPMLHNQARKAFDAWFATDRPTHERLLAFSRRPWSMPVRAPAD